MQDEGKVYGFTISLYEYGGTIPTLWETTRSEFKTTCERSATEQIHAFAEFMEQHPEYIAKDNAMAFISDDGGNAYNLCHCECSY